MSEQINRYSTKGIFWSLFYISVTFPLPYKISNIGLGMLVITCLIKWLVDRKSFRFDFGTTSQKIIFFSFIGFFLWQIVALLYTNDIQNGWKNVESKLTLLILPLIFYTIQLTRHEVKKLIIAYIYSIGLCSLFLFGQSFYHWLTQGSLLTYHDFTRSLNFHAVFYSYNLFLSILLTVYMLTTEKVNKATKMLLGFSIILSVSGLIISASKNVLVVTTLFLMVGYVLKSIRKKFSIKEFGLLLGGIIILAAVVVAIPSIGSRIKQLAEMNGMENYHKIKRGEMIVAEDIPKFNGTSMRITFWDVALQKQLREGKLLLGYSPGDRRAVINEEFYKNGLNPWYKNYNLHNQFVQILVELGLIGLLLYLLVYFGYIKLAYEDRNYVLLAFVIGLCFFQITESIIERNKGIVFLTYFLLFLAKIKPPLDENRNHRN